MTAAGYGGNPHGAGRRSGVILGTLYLIRQPPVFAEDSADKEPPAALRAGCLLHGQRLFHGRLRCAGQSPGLGFASPEDRRYLQIRCRHLCLWRRCCRATCVRRSKQSTGLFRSPDGESRLTLHHRHGKRRRQSHLHLRRQRQHDGRRWAQRELELVQHGRPDHAGHHHCRLHL